MDATGLAPFTTHAEPQPPQGRTLAEANRLLARTWQELAEARQIISRQTRRTWWEQEVDRIPHKDLSATDKLVLRDLYGQQEQWTTFARPGPQRVWCAGRARELGLSADTYARALKTLHECQALTRTVEKDPTSGNTRVTVELAEKFWAPATISRPTPRQQGGERQVPRCPACDPDTPVMEHQETRTAWFCGGCGDPLGEATTRRPVRRVAAGGAIADPDDPAPDPLPAPPSPSEQDDDHAARFTAALAAAPIRRPVTDIAGNLAAREAEEPATSVEPDPQATPTDSPPPQPLSHGWSSTAMPSPGSHAHPADPTIDERVLARLDQFAGNCPRHIAMEPSGPRKYAWQKDAAGQDLPLTRDLLAAHLAGMRTLGSELRWIVGTGARRHAVTYLLGWDADNAADLAALIACAAGLHASGARPILERSPSATHAGGGRLWLFFAAAVDPGAAWATATKHAPHLATIRECWPSWQVGPDDRGQAVRLPAGVYQRDAVRAPIPHAPWEPTGLVWRTGRAAAALLLTEATPAAWVTEPAPAPPPERHPTPPPILDPTPIAPTATPSEPAAWHDPRWLARYSHNRHRLPFAVTEKEAIAWFNARHDVRELLPKEHNGYARATWRGERTPSVGYLPNNAWIDYGRGGQAGGRRDGGDAFDALCRLKGLDRGAALEQIVLPALLAEAKTLLDGAAHTGAGVPGWVASITSPAGWERYRQLSTADETNQAPEA